MLNWHRIEVRGDKKGRPGRPVSISPSPSSLGFCRSNTAAAQNGQLPEFKGTESPLLFCDHVLAPKRWWSQNFLRSHNPHRTKSSNFQKSTVPGRCLKCLSCLWKGILRLRVVFAWCDSLTLVLLVLMQKRSTPDHFLEERSNSTWPNLG